MAAEQIPLIELESMPVSSEPVETEDLYLLVAWRTYRKDVCPYKLGIIVREKIDHRTSLDAIQRAVGDLKAPWTHHEIFHCRIGGKP